MKEITRKHVGKVLRKFRDNKSQKQIAYALGCSQGNYSKFETGLLEPSVTQWIAFCRVTGAPMNALTRESAPLL